MSYLQLNRRQSTGTLIRENNFIFEGKQSNVKLIKLAKPYADGTRYAVIEDTKNPFCSNGLFISLLSAKLKYDLILHNCKINEGQFKESPNPFKLQIKG